jgi:hypothetical protein
MGFKLVTILDAAAFNMLPYCRCFQVVQVFDSVSHFQKDREVQADFKQSNKNKLEATQK